MDPGNIPFHVFSVGPTNLAKMQFLVNQLCGPFNGKFDHIVLISPTFAYNRTLYRFGERDPRLYVLICEQHQVEIFLKLVSFAFEGTNTLIVLDNCAASKDDVLESLPNSDFQHAMPAIVCGCLLSSSPASRSLFKRMSQQSFFFTHHLPRPRRPSSKNTRASFLMANSSR